MRRSSKTVQPAIYDFSDFSGGLNLRTMPENIEQNELAACVNMTYKTNPGRLCTRPGVGLPLVTYDAEVAGLTWFNDELLAAAGGKLYRVMPDAYEIGALSGEERPVWCEFGGELFIATGGKIQKLTKAGAFSTIEDSPLNAVGLYARAGRLFCWESKSDVLRGSAVGDAESWTVPDTATDSDAVELGIGYKVAGNVVCCVPSLSDVVIFKDQAVFRLAGEYPDWEIIEVSRDERIMNKDCAAEVSGYLFYIERDKGIRRLEGTNTYSHVMPADVLQKVNPWIRGALSDGARLVNMPGRNILLICPGGETVMPGFYEYGLDAMPALQWKMHGAVHDVCEPSRNSLYVAIGNSVYDWSGSFYTDPTGKNGTLEPVECSFSSKVFVSFNGYVLERISVNAQALDDSTETEPVHIRINDTEYESVVFFTDESPIVYGNMEVVHESPLEFSSISNEFVDFSTHNMFRCPRFQVNFYGKSTPFELGRFRAEVYVVGVIS